MDDANEAYAELREMTKRPNCRAVELFAILDQWLRRGGYLPDAWCHAGTMKNVSKGVLAARRAQTIEMAALRDQGLTYPAIAERYDLDPKCVWNRVNKYRKGLYTRRVLIDGKEFRE